MIANLGGTPEFHGVPHEIVDPAERSPVACDRGF